MKDLDNQSFKKPKFDQRDEQRGSSPNSKRDHPKNNSRKYSGNQRRNNRKREYKVPEHVKNPSKFKKYDLSDVKLTDGKVSYLVWVKGGTTGSRPEMTFPYKKTKFRCGAELFGRTERSKTRTRRKII